MIPEKHVRPITKAAAALPDAKCGRKKENVRPQRVLFRTHFFNQKLLTDGAGRFDFDPAMIRIHPDNGGGKMLYGAKVLGSYVGSEESIANRLEKKLAELKKEADAITTVGSFQVQYLLLRWCFCRKIIHLQRTIPPNLIGTYLEPGFTELKKLILNSTLGRADGIPKRPSPWLSCIFKTLASDSSTARILQRQPS